MRFSAAVALMWSLSAPALADDGGIPVRVVVTDAAGNVIPTAEVAHPDEASHHNVSEADGSWEGTKLYLKTGEELVFTPGVELTLAVSAPGYRTAEVAYTVKKKKNVVKVALEALPAMSAQPGVDPSIGFDHDDPIDGAAP